MKHRKWADAMWIAGVILYMGWWVVVITEIGRIRSPTEKERHQKLVNRIEWLERWGARK